MAGRSLSVGLLALFHAFGFLSLLILQWPRPYSMILFSNGVCSLLFAALGVVLMKCRRRSDIVSGLAAVILVCSFDLPNNAAIACGDRASTYLVL